MPPEHRRECALAGIAAVERDIDDSVAVGQAFEREQQTCLLAPLAERQPRLVQEAALKRAFRQTDTRRPLPYRKISIRRIDQGTADTPQPFVLGKGEMKRQDGHRMQFVE